MAEEKGNKIHWNTQNGGQAACPVMTVPDEPMRLHQLPFDVRMQWIAKHKECFPQLWATCPHEQLYDVLYTMDLRELLYADAAAC